MTVSELIEILKQQPPDRLVIVQGYEGGYSDIDGHQTIAVVDDPVQWQGRYQYDRYDAADKIYAYCLFRESNY